MEPDNPETDLTLSMYQLPTSPASYEPLDATRMQQIRDTLNEELNIRPLLPHQKRVYGGHVLQKFNPSLNITPPVAGASHEEQLTYCIRLFAAFHGKSNASNSIKKFDGNYSEFIPFWEHFITAVDNDPKLTILEKFDTLLSKLGESPKSKIQYLPKTEQNYHVALSIILNEYGVIVEIVRVLLEKFYATKRYDNNANHYRVEQFFCTVTNLVQTLAKFAPEYLQGRQILNVIERKISHKHFVKWRKTLDVLWEKCGYNYQLYEEFQFRFLLKMLRDEIRLLKECRLYNVEQGLATLPHGLQSSKPSNHSRSYSSNQISTTENKLERGRPKTKLSNGRGRSMIRFSKSPSSTNNTPKKRTFLSPNQPPPRPARSSSFGRSASRSPGRNKVSQVGKCLFCGKVHNLSSCPNTTVAQRIQLIEKQGRCRRCFKDHLSSACTSTKRCATCGSDRHHTALHDPGMQKALKFRKNKKQ